MNPSCERRQMPRLDGLRALVVAEVVADHAQPSMLPAGTAAWTVFS
jgi:peptidoglycan/LPS O-acetylase OafA/YrhL